LDELRSFGVPSSRIVPVVNRAPKSPAARAELTTTVAALAAPGGDPLPSPVFLPERRIDDTLRDGMRMPGALTEPLAGAFSALVDADAGAVDRGRGGRPVTPGSLGAWAGPETEGAIDRR
ncbi:MAG TPA: hypothetical protein VE760_02810, partial [Acidimicrobiales bacterium]|nr:hypothetical protein [Acidimicrobiales bacterium]